jgi:histidinol phosphatase-like enzyme
MKTAVFFEWEGVLNQRGMARGRQVVPRQLEEFWVVPEGAHLLGGTKSPGFVLIATTIQPGSSRGELRRNEVDLMHTLPRRKLPLNDFLLDGSDDPTHQGLKPNPGMLLEAAFKWSLDLDQRFVVSDKW